MTYSQAHQPSDAHENPGPSGALGRSRLSRDRHAAHPDGEDISSSSLTIGITLTVGVFVMVAVLLLPYIGVM